MVSAERVQVGEARSGAVDAVDAVDAADAVDPAAFRAVLARFPTGVTIVTTRDGAGRPWGFTASSFCSVSLTPPLVLVCVASSANCHPAFAGCTAFAVSILRPHHAELARRFASKTAEKFAYGRFRRLPSGIDVVEEAVAVLECTVHERLDAGDHTIIVGLVHYTSLGAEGAPAVYVDRSFTSVR